jgi:predicted Rossmann fold nucleotide-binding protein DprA/Smf involved in DNA uptake
MDGSLLLTAEEQERQRAEQAEAQVQKIALNLMQTGMDLEQVAQVTGLTISQVESLQT